MSGHDYTVELKEVREILNDLRKAYKERAADRGMTKRHEIKDHEMEFSNPADLLRRIQFWQREITRLEAAARIFPRRSNRTITRL